MTDAKSTGESFLGRFTKAEDEAILEAVKKYGENFAIIKEAIGSKRTARHIASHYQYSLNPATDRSEWSPEEEEQVYQKFLELKDMKKVKDTLGSRRSIKDMWNHLFKADRKHLNMNIPEYRRIRPERVRLFKQEKSEEKKEEKEEKEEQINVV